MVMLGPLSRTRPGGRPRKTDMRFVYDERGILYLLRTGCPWRYLPQDSFSALDRSQHLRKFQAGQVWSAIWDRLYVMLRQRGSRGQSIGRHHRQPNHQVG